MYYIEYYNKGLFNVRHSIVYTKSLSEYYQLEREIKRSKKHIFIRGGLYAL